MITPALSGGVARTAAVCAAASFAAVVVIELTHTAFLDRCHVSHESPQSIVGFSAVGIALIISTLYGYAATKTRRSRTLAAVFVGLQVLFFWWLLAPTGSCGT